MLYADESVLFAQDMKSPRELLAEALEEKKIRQVDLGRMLGYKNPYHAVHSIVTGDRPFSRRLQERVADLLGYPKNHFEAPDETARRVAYIHRTFQAFLHTDIGAKTDEETRRILQGMPFTGKRLPTVALYQAFALALEGKLYTSDQLDQLEQDLQLNEELDRRNDDELPPDKPPRPRAPGSRAKPVRQK
jgi:hypothetical protein